MEPFAGREFLDRRFQCVGFLDQPLNVFSARAVKVVNGLNLLKTRFQLLELIGKYLRIGLASFLVLEKQSERFRDFSVIFAPGIIKEGDQGGVRHAFELCHASQGRLAAHIHNLLTEPLKTLIVNRFIREHISRGFELNRPEFLKSAPEFYAFARPRTGEIEQKEKPGT